MEKGCRATRQYTCPGETPGQEGELILDRQITYM